MSAQPPLPSSSPSPTSTVPFLVRFYDPSIRAPDARNRTLSTILSWPDSALEASHDYIQILFPLPEYSPINPSAPIIDEATFTHFRSSPVLRAELRRAFERMLAFYGLEASSSSSSSSSLSSSPSSSSSPSTSSSIDRYTIAPSSPSSLSTSKASRWATSGFTHNHLRITRIIRSLRVLGCRTEAAAFFDALRRIAVEQGESARGSGRAASSGKISARSLGFWTRAATEPLNVPPEDERGDHGQGQRWLRGL